VIKVNNRKVLDGVLEAIGLGGDDKAGQRLACCAPSTSSTSSARGRAALLGHGAQGRERRLYQGRGAG
jgi:histidyl-tRNA synthetase